MSAIESTGFAVSEAPSIADAVAEAVAGAKVDAPSIAFISCTVDRPPEDVQAEFAKALPGVALHGVTSSGAVLSLDGPRPAGIGCLLIKAAEGALAAASDMSGDAAAAATVLKAKVANPKAVIIAATPGTEEKAIMDVEGVFGCDVQIFGGTAADNTVEGNWRVMSTEGCSATGISLVAVGQGVQFGASMIGPYQPTAKMATATKTDGRRVHEINGMPAADWALDWIGDDVAEQYAKGGLILASTAFRPVSIKQPSGEYVTGHLAAMGGEEKFVDFFVPIPEGSELTVMEAGDGPSTGYEAALAAAYDQAVAAGAADPRAGLLIYCGGMAIAVGDQLGAGLTGSIKGKAGDVPILGMTCFGEQGCLPVAKKNTQNNLSVGFILLG